MIAISLSSTNLQKDIPYFKIFLSLFLHFFLLILWKPCYHYILFSQKKIGAGVISSLLASHLFTGQKCTWVHFIHTSNEGARELLRHGKRTHAYTHTHTHKEGGATATRNAPRQTANVRTHAYTHAHAYTHPHYHHHPPSKTPKSPTRGKLSAPPPSKKKSVSESGSLVWDRI